MLCHISWLPLNDTAAAAGSYYIGMMIYSPLRHNNGGQHSELETCNRPADSEQMTKEKKSCLLVMGCL